MRQDQFLNVIDRDEAERRFRQALRLEPLGAETVALPDALGRVLAADIVAPLDVPSFDRSNFDGFAVLASDTYGATEESPKALRLLAEQATPGVAPSGEVLPGTAMAIATGAMVPRGADAVVMVEDTEQEGDRLLVRRAVPPGFGVTFAGTDIAAGETVLWQGDLLTSRETGVLAALGIDRVSVWRRPRVAIISTGDEIVAPGSRMRPGLVFDCNSRTIADAVREAGGLAVEMGIVRDEPLMLRERLAHALELADVVLLSGGTSKGPGDLCYRVVREMTQPGIVAHGVALKPGKPICLAAHQGKPVVILPGFPTSAIFTFHEFVAPVIRQLGGLAAEQRSTARARLAVKINSEIGRTEYVLVGLVQRSQAADVRLAAYPMGKGSGSVTTFSKADGFITIGRHEELVEAGTVVDVQLLSRDLRVADLVVIGSHCPGLDFLLSRLRRQGWAIKFLAVGSLGGLEAARRGECDVAGIHLFDLQTGRYNEPFVTDPLVLVRGYGRTQGLVFRRDDPRFCGRDPREAIAAAAEDARCVMVNRNAGSGTRILIDRLLGGKKPRGYAVEARSHNAVVAAVAQRRADWGVAIRQAAERAGLGFSPLADEQFDFVVVRERMERPAVRAFLQLLQDEAVRRRLADMGFRLSTPDQPS